MALCQVHLSATHSARQSVLRSMLPPEPQRGCRAKASVLLWEWLPAHRSPSKGWHLALQPARRLARRTENLLWERGCQWEPPKEHL